MTEVNRFVDFLESTQEERMKVIDVLYSEKLDFRDPVNEARTRDHFKKIEVDLFMQLKDISFRVLDSYGDGSQGMVKWRMNYRFRRRNRKIEGVSHIKFNEERKIVFQHDYWDASFAVYGEFPILGLMMKGVRKILRVKA